MAFGDEDRVAIVRMPKQLWVRNITWPPGPFGKGCCVFSAITDAGRYQNIRELVNLITNDRDGGKAQYIREGGGWPEKVSEVMRHLAPDVPYIQYPYSGNDPTLMYMALASGRPCCITYGYGPGYAGTISHMVLLVSLDSEWGCIQDNNTPGVELWIKTPELLKRWTWPSGRGWAIVFLSPPPPPLPTN